MTNAPPPLPHGILLPPTVVSVGENRRPPRGFVVALACCILAQTLLMVLGGPRSNVLGAAVGLVVAVVLLGLHRSDVLKRSSDGRFTEWATLSSGRVSTALALASWSIGVLNVYWVALEITR